MMTCETCETCERISNAEIIELIRAQCGNDQRIMQCVDRVMCDRLLNETNRRMALWQILKYPADMAVYFFGRGE